MLLSQTKKEASELKHAEKSLAAAEKDLTKGEKVSPLCLPSPSPLLALTDALSAARISPDPRRQHEHKAEHARDKAIKAETKTAHKLTQAEAKHNVRPRARLALSPSLLRAAS